MASINTSVPSNITITSSIVTTMSSNISKIPNSNLVCYRLGLHLLHPTLHGMTSLISSSILGAIISVVATSMNTLTLYVWYQFPNLRSLTNLLLVSLSVTDLLVGIAAVPLSIAARVTETMKIHLCWLQSLSTFISILLAPFSAFVISFIGIDRYIAVFYPNAYRQPHMRRKYVKAMFTVASIWLILVSLLSYVDEQLNKSVIRACVVGLLICYFALITFCYLKTARWLKMHSNRIADQSTASFATRRNQQLKHQFKVMTILVSVFLACYIPKLITVIITMMGTSFEISNVATQWSDLSVFLNSALNPFLYMWRIKDLRRAVLTVTRCSQRNRIEVTTAKDGGGDLG